MEVGAVKQAFNNEVILLKKSLQQAKIQVIHKLTRKAKTLTEKKGPDHIKEKFKRKAELAVKEVLAIKKIKARDIARFIVTHKGELNEYLNKPAIDENRACARLLLHKSMTNKYNTIKSKFGNVSIHDLLMSRQERRKLKKEAKEKQKEKSKKQTDKSDKVSGVWDVENNDNSKINSDLGNISDNESSEDDTDYNTNNVSESDIDEDANNKSEEEHELTQENESESIGELSDSEMMKNSEIKIVNNSHESKTKAAKTLKQSLSVSQNKLKQKLLKVNSDIEMDAKPLTNDSKQVENNKRKSKGNVLGHNLNEDASKSFSTSTANNNLSTNSAKKLDKKAKEGHKNKNLNEKLLNRNFKKKADEEGLEPTMVVDPFFVTSTGENYMSLVEARPPDELTDEHKTGNRKYRRAVMFGHVPKTKTHRNFNNFNDKQNNFSSKFENHDKQFKNNDKQFHNNNKQFKNNDREDTKDDSKAPEKLHPSWEAKKRQSSILPFKGKKITFDDA